MNIRLATATIVIAMGTTQTVLAQDADEWIVRGGFHSMEPKSSAQQLTVDGTIGLTFTVTHMLAPKWGVELFAALPFPARDHIAGCRSRRGDRSSAAHAQRAVPLQSQSPRAALHWRGTQLHSLLQGTHIRRVAGNETRAGFLVWPRRLTRHRHRRHSRLVHQSGRALVRH